jgi:probable addiction module antidote protein
MNTSKEAVEGNEFDLDKINALPVFRAADYYLESPAMLAAYLTEALREDDAHYFVDALRTAARAQGMADVASKAGLTREALYKALRAGNRQPRLATVLGVLEALGLHLVVQPAVIPDEPSDG